MMRQFDLARVRNQLASLHGTGKLARWRLIPPTDAAIKLADRTLEKLVLELDAVPDRVVPDADGGIVFYFFAGDKQSALFCDNDGELNVLVCERDVGESMRAWEIDATKIPIMELKRVLDFVWKINE